MNIKQQTKTALHAGIVLTALIPLLAALFFNRCTMDWFVENNDNFSIAAVTGNLKYSNYCIFLNPVLCGVIHSIAALLPKADAFALTSLILCELAFVSAAVLIFKRTSGAKRLIFLTAVAVYASLGVYTQNFTVIAAFLTMTGAVPLLSAVISGKRNGIHTLISVFFISFGCMYRSECALLFIPFAAVCVLAALFQNKGQQKAFCFNAAAVLLPAAAAAAVLFGIALAVSGTPNIKAGLDFNTARARVQDYPLLPYEKAKESLPADVTENDYTLITHFMTPDTQRMNTEYLRAFANAAIDSTPNRAEIIRSTLAKNKYSLKSAVLFIFALAVFLTVMLSRENKIKKAAALLCFLGIPMCCAVFLYLGRLPERVLISVITAGMTSLCAILYNTEIKDSKAVYFVFAVIIAAAFARYAVKDAGGKPSAIFTAKVYPADFEAPLDATYTDGCVFVWDTINYSLAPAMYFSANGKLPSEQFELHNISAGGWSYMQLYQRQAFAEMGIQNPAYDLVYRPGTYYVGELSVMETYIKEHIEPNIRSEHIGDILNTPVYKFSLEK